MRIYGCKCWALVPKAIRKKGEYRSIEGIFVGYYDNSKAYKVWIPRTQSIIKARDVIFDKSNYIERIIIHATDEDNLPNLWADECLPSTSTPVLSDDISPPTVDNEPPQDEPSIEVPTTDTNNSDKIHEENHPNETPIITPPNDPTDVIPIAPKDFQQGRWIDPANETYGCGKRQRILRAEEKAVTCILSDLKEVESAFVTLAEDEPSNYNDAMRSINADEWRSACTAEYDVLMGYHTWKLVERPADTNIVGSHGSSG